VDSNPRLRFRTWRALVIGGLLAGALFATGIKDASAGGTPGSFHVTLTGNGTVSVVGGTSNVIHCQRAGGTTFGVCDWSYDIDVVPNVTLTVTTPIGSAFCDSNACYAEGATTDIVVASGNSVTWAGFVGLDNRFVSVGKAGTGTGSVTSTDGKINCPASCQNTGSIGYTFGDHVTLHAVAASGSTFAGWNGEACGGEIAATCSFILNTSDLESGIGAIFKAKAASTPAPTRTPAPGHTAAPGPTAAPGTTQPIATTLPADTGSATGATDGPNASHPADGASSSPNVDTSATPGTVTPAATPASLDTGWIAFLLLLVLVIGVSVGGVIAFVVMRRRSPPSAT
jgi:Divergent InlB B-repeat domain